MGFLKRIFRSVEIDQQKRIYENLKKQQSFLVEVNNRRRIYDDSRKLMETTNNIDVFIKRTDNILEFTKWIFNAQSEGMPVKIQGTLEDALHEYIHDYNVNLIRICKYMIEKSKTVKSKEKTKLSLTSILKDAIEKCDNENDLLSLKDLSKSIEFQSK